MYQKITRELKKNEVELVAVSKTKPIPQVMDIYDQGQRHFGENRVQDLVQRELLLPKDIRWHFIGHLQKNKVKYIAEFVYLIHSVDSLSLLKEINKQAKKHDRIIPVLLQMKIADEESKYGMDWQTVQELIDSEAYQNMLNVQIRGVMGMATFTDDMNQVRREFARLKGIYTELKEAFFSDSPYFREVSMGMSGDYQIAIEEGSTMVRIGSLIFGPRE